MADPSIKDLLPNELVQVDAVLEKLGVYDSVKNWLGRATAYPVLFLGASGAGKTALLRSLAGLPPFVRRDNRTDEVSVAKKKLGSLFVEAIDTPGEEEHQDKRDIFLRNIAAKKSVGVVNVVSYGFHEGKALQKVALEGDSAAQAFLEARRKVELGLLDQWVAQYSGRGGNISWILTVVTKADLWWQSGVDQSVLEYYEGESYKSKFKVSDGTPHSIKPFSALNHLFYDKAPMSGFYSDARREQDRAAVMAHILAKAAEHG